MANHRLFALGSLCSLCLLWAPAVYAQSGVATDGAATLQPSGVNPTSVPAGTPTAAADGAAPVAAAEGAAPVATTDGAPPVAPPTSPTVPVKAGDCRLGDHAGFNKDDARTTASIVCRELPADAMASGYSFRVDLDKLGIRAFLTLSAISNGTTVGSRRITLDRIEDVPIVAPRLVDALLNNKSIKQTERFGNLTTADARTPIRRDGKAQVSAGVLAVMAPGIDTISPGLDFALHYDTPRWVLAAQFRCAWGVGDHEELGMVQAGVGPRYMLSEEDTSLFLGGGMAVDHLWADQEVTTPDGTRASRSGDDGGVAPYAEVGVEVMRLHRMHLNFALRADVSLFQVSDDYLVPISLSTSFLFD